MADRRYLERIELLTGTGRVFEGSQEIATTRYRVEILQEKIESRTSSGVHTLDGLKEIRGTITPVEVSIGVLWGKTLILVFEDGKRMEFSVSRTNLSANNGFIRASSAIQ